MGALVYCELCRCPIKEFDYPDTKFCGHSDKYTDTGVYLSGDTNIERWNKEHPDRPINEDITYCRIKSPYMVNQLGLLLFEAEDIVNERK